MKYSESNLIHERKNRPTMRAPDGWEPLHVFAFSGSGFFPFRQRVHAPTAPFGFDINHRMSGPPDLVKISVIPPILASSTRHEYP